MEVKQWVELLLSVSSLRQSPGHPRNGNFIDLVEKHQGIGELGKLDPPEPPQTPPPLQSQ